MKKINTPYFVIDRVHLDELTDTFIESFKQKWPKGITGYSFKTNNLPWVISYMREKGLWAEVVSSDEFQLARKLGFDFSNIIFNGPVKGKNEFIIAVENGSVVNLDSHRELEWLKECKKQKIRQSHIGLRVNYCIEELCPGESQCGDADGRFGFSYEEGDLISAIQFLQKNDIPLSGLHLHCSSKTRSINIYKAIAEMAKEIVIKYDLNLKYIDIGGGFFGGVPGKPSFDMYFNEIYNIFSDNEKLSKINVIVEPGISLIGAPIDYVTTVSDVKHTKHNTFAVLDGSRIHIDPLMRKNQYTYYIKSSNQKAVNKYENIVFCGFTCMENDRFFIQKDCIVDINDEVIFKKVGAYTMGLSPQFIEFYPPVYVRNFDNSMLEIRKKFTAEDFVKGSTLE